MDDLPDMCRDDPTCYGLLQSVECYSSYEIGTPTKSFNFLHLGIQEYFAAKYVATLPEDEVYTLMKESFLVTDECLNLDSKSVRLSNMWIIYCGITSGRCNSLIHFLSGNTLPNRFRQYPRIASSYHRASPTLGMQPLKSTPCHDEGSDNDSLCNDNYFIPSSLSCGNTHTDGEYNDSYHSAEDNVPLLPDDDDDNDDLVSSDHCLYHPPSTMSHWSDPLSFSSPSLTPPTKPVRYPLSPSRGQQFVNFFQRLKSHILHPFLRWQQSYHPVSSHHDPSNSEHVTTNIDPQVTSDYMDAPSQQGSTSGQEISNTLSISQDILKNQMKVHYLFQCFQEAQDDRLCDILSKSFDSGEIDLSHYSLAPYQVVSLGFFLSRSHRKWKELNLYIGDHGINLLHRYIHLWR